MLLCVRQAHTLAERNKNRLASVCASGPHTGQETPWVKPGHKYRQAATPLISGQCSPTMHSKHTQASKARNP